MTLQAPPAAAITDRAVNLFGDRHIEWSFVAANIPQGPGEAFEFGPGESWISLVAIHRGFNVTTVDLQVAPRPYVEPKLRDIQGDLLDLDLPPASFDLVINCSAIEHVGLAGRYSVSAGIQDGDLEAMRTLRTIMKPRALMILTIPLGRDALFAPMCRVYGRQRLPQLLERFNIEHQSHWIKESDNLWRRCSLETALDFPADAGSTDWRQNIYALGCFTLRLSHDPTDTSPA